MTLDQRPANSLLAALVAQRTAEYGIRCILIKGCSLEFHNLRRGFVPADTDVLVEPGRAVELVEALGSDGWFERPASLGTSRITTHSFTLVRDLWANELDVHGEYPGLSEPTAAFDRLWGTRVALEVAGLHCWIPDKASAMTLWALHSLRGTDQQPRHRRELEHLLKNVLPTLSIFEHAELGSRIVELGADHALNEVSELAVLIGDRVSALDPACWVSWRRKMAQAHEVTPWLQVLREASRWEWPWLVWRAAWPSRHDVRLLDEHLVDTCVGRVQSRVRRIARMVSRVVERRSSL